MAARTAAIDALVTSHFHPPPGVALLAVGGYGRRELFPYSDVDLLILCANVQARDELGEELSEFLRTLWDFGLRVSQSVRTREECAGLDLTNVELAVSLLDRRFLSGDKDLFASLVTPSPEKLGTHLAALTRQRHHKFQNTIFHLEPNVKDAPGGLRDVQVIRWLSGRNPAPAAFEMLSRIRSALHRAAGRDQNILSFAMQDELAGNHDASALMRDYFQSANIIHRYCLRELDAAETRRSGLLSQFRNRSSKLSNGDFSVVRGCVFLRAPQLNAALVTQLLFFVGRHGLPLSPDLEDRLTAFRGYQMRWPELRGLLELPQPHKALRVMHTTGLLEQVFPELTPINGMVVRDFYHRYTVDEHTLVTIDNAVSRKEEPFEGLTREIENRCLLLIALLFHDAGKGGGESHAESSAVLAESALARIGMPQADLTTVAFLIRAHLELSSAMTSRDLSDVSTAQQIAQSIGTVERLRMLTLLTYCDISSVHPGAMTPWRSSLLWQLYTATYQELTRELGASLVPARYARTHTPEEIAAHRRLVEISKVRGASVAFARKAPGIYEITIAARDHMFLFADLAGAISSFGLNILKAEAFAAEAGSALDSLCVEDPLRTLELNPSEMDRLAHVIEDVATERKKARDLLRGRPNPKRDKRTPPAIGVDNAASPRATLFEITADDRPGLLYDLAACFSGEECNVEIALIDTKAHRAIDVFYVTKNGERLSDEAASALSQKLRQSLVTS